MKKLHFKFIDDGKILIDKTVEYCLKNKKYIFKIEEYDFSLEVSPIFKIVREDEEAIFTLEENSKSGKAIYELKNPYAKLEIELKHFKVIKNESEYIMEYVIESDEENKKIIHISI